MDHIDRAGDMRLDLLCRGADGVHALHALVK